MGTSEKIAAIIIGGSGFGAGELLRLLSRHPVVKVIATISQSQSGKRIDVVHPHLQGFYEDSFVSEMPVESLGCYKSIVIFSAVPHGVSAKRISKLEEELPDVDYKVIDFSGDLRLKDLNVHKKFYPEVEAFSELREKAVYGLPELHKDEIVSAEIIANPGCLSSSSILSIAPIVARGLVKNIVIDAKTGISGAGRTASEKTHHGYRSSNVEAYNILEHRHEAEIRQELALLAGGALEMSFVPHLIPSVRGIFITAYCLLNTELSQSAVNVIYEKFYKESAFVRMRYGSPKIQNVIGTNFFDYSVKVRRNQLVACGVIDNLGKGMASVAVQNLNLISGLSEKDRSLGACFGSGVSRT